MKHPDVLVMEAFRRQNRLHHAEQAQQNIEANLPTQWFPPRDQGRQQEQAADDLNQQKAEAAMGIETLRVVDVGAGLQPEQADANQEELHDHTDEVERDEVSL